MLSELASNAVQHAASAFTVWATIADSTLHLAVEDGGSLRNVAMTVLPNHGLGVVDTLALRWGIETTPTARWSGPSSRCELRPRRARR